MRNVVALVAWLLAANLQAGVVFELESKNNATNPPQLLNTRVMVEGRLLKMQTAANGQGEPTEVIFRGDRREMIMVDHRTRTFIVMDQQALQAMRAQMSQATWQMNQALQNMTPQQRALAGPMIPVAKTGPPATQLAPLTVRQLNNRTTVYGYPSTLVEVQRDGRKIGNLWITAWQNIDGSQEVAPALADMASFFLAFTRATSQSGGMNKTMTDNPFIALDKLNGFPVASRNYREDGTVESESALRTAQKVQFNATEFQPPAGYQQNRLFGR